MVECIEVKVGNSKRLVLKDGILQEKGLDPMERRQGLISELLMILLVFMFFGKEFGSLMALNTVVNRVVKFFI